MGNYLFSTINISNKRKSSSPPKLLESCLNYQPPHQNQSSHNNNNNNIDDSLLPLLHQLKVLIGKNSSTYYSASTQQSYLHDIQFKSFIDATDAQGNTCLHAAIFKGYLPIVHFLLYTCGADLTLRNDLGCNAIWIAAGYGHEDILSLLLGYIHNSFYSIHHTTSITSNDLIQQPNEMGDTPLIASVSKNHVQIVKMLLQTMEQDQGKEAAYQYLCTKNHNGDSCLSVAVANGYDGEILSYLLEYDSNHHDDNSNTNTHDSNKNHSTLNLLNQVNTKKGGLTPLLIACERNNPTIVRKLLDYNASLLICDEKGRSPLSIASFCGCMDVMNLLLSYISSTTTTTTTTLLLQSLLNQKDNNGCTPLWLASRTGNVSMVKVLIQAGADVTLKDTVENLTAEEIAIKYKKSRVIDYFDSLKAI